MIKLLSGYRGSKAHGTFIEGVSDTDTFEIVAMPIEYYFGLKSFETSHGEDDNLIHDIKKFVSLLLKSNPSALELLFVDGIKIHHNAVLPLVLNREMFLSKKIVSPILGHVKHTLARRNDAKGYTHCIRLLLMGIEVLSGKGLLVNRPDAKVLMEFKTGGLNDTVYINYIQQLENRLKELEQSSTIRTEPDRDKAEQILVNMLKELYAN